MTNPKMTDMPWMIEAKRWQGAHEVRDNTRIWGAIKNWLTEKLNPARYPWCGAFMGIVFKASMPREAIPSAPWGARNWRSFGTKCEPATGAVAVFWRGKPNGPFGHVGLVVGIDRKRDRLLILGGNQGDVVSEKWFPRSRLLECRWPSTAKVSPGRVDELSSAGAKLSTNEA